MGGHWDTNVENVLCEYAKSGMHVVDIGANMGYYTVKLATKVGSSGRLIAFEPNPEVYAMRFENLKTNGFMGHARVERLALGDKPGTARLTRSHSNMASANLLGDQDAGATFDVEVSTLDAILPGDEKIDLIKLDAEGYEPFILKGAARTLERPPSCAIMIGLGMERWGRFARLNDLVSLCGGQGREIFAVHDHGTIEKFKGDLRNFL